MASDEKNSKFFRDVNIPQETWFGSYEFDLRAKPALIESGYRKKSITSCQYYINGLPNVCGFWSKDENKCTFKIQTENDVPSSYNDGNCDFMGRQVECTKYSGEGSDPEYHCVLINPFLSGVLDSEGKPISSQSFSSAYNKGNCDFQGMGRGNQLDMTSSSVSQAMKLPIVCPYYRPWQMSVGFTLPQSYEDAIREYKLLTTYSEAYYRSLAKYEKSHSFGVRLPFYFEVLNMRAHMQKCLFWDSDYGAKFFIDKSNESYTIKLSESRCICPYEVSNKYSTPDSGSNSWLLREIWSTEAGGVVCNGAHTKCPCYSGEWLYCTNDAMENGMRVTVNQIMELRFWTNEWDSQWDYDRYFENRPNWVDTTTADLFAFSHYSDESNVSERIMQGYRLHMCMPSDAWLKYFDPDVYLQLDPVVFSSGATTVFDQDGTGIPIEDDTSLYYPTLMRSSWSYEDFNQLLVLYPFVNDSYLEHSDKVGCNKDEVSHGVFVKYTNQPRHDFIVSVGQTIRNKEVYLINLSIVGDSLVGVENNLNSTRLSQKQRIEIETSLFTQISNFKIDFPSAVSKTTTDAVSGFFISNPVRLILNRLNHLVIIVKISDDRIEFRHRLVQSKFCGGLLQQTSFTYEPSKNGLAQSLFGYFNPTPEIEGTYATIGPVIDVKVKPIHSMHAISLMGEYDLYAYSIKKVSFPPADFEWSPVGNSSYIMVYVRDDDINYLFKWAAVSISVKRIADDNDTGLLELDECSSPQEIEFEMVYPNNQPIEFYIDNDDYNFNSTEYSVSQAYSFTTPGVGIFRPKQEKDRYRRYSKLKWTLDFTIWTYKFEANPQRPETDLPQDTSYAVLDNYRGDVGEVTAPRVGYNKNDSGFVHTYQNVAIPFKFEDLGNEFKISKFKTGPVGVVGFGKAPDGKFVTADAAKLYTYAGTIFFRSVEVNHAYRATAPLQELNPSHGWALAPGGGYSPTGVQRSVYFHAPCGDHLTSAASAEGPMWYPHAACDNKAIYQEWSMCAYCASPYEGTPRNDMRFCGVVREKTWGDMPRGNWASTCGVSCYYLYANFKDESFGGYANLVNSVNEAEYVANKWRLPPFGNFSRNFVDRALCKDYVVYRVDNDFRSAWAPMVADNSMFHVSFNAFDEWSDTNASDPVSFSEPLNYLLCGAISEKIDYKHRLRWEEVFEIRRFVHGAYPKPLIFTPVGTSAIGYTFKESNFAWAWREYWLPIERGENLQNVHLIPPSYAYDIYKKEYRYITDEGKTTISFKAPVREGSKYVDNYPPTLQLGSGPPRMFEFVYENLSEYNDTPLVWLDDYDKKHKVYSEVNSNSKFDHDENTLFDASFSSTPEEAENDGKSRVIGVDMFTGEETKSVFNRGLIVKMSKRDILGFEYSIKNSLFTGDLPLSNIGRSLKEYTWRKTSDFSVVVSEMFITSDELSLESLVVEGIWGYLASDELYVGIPKITITIETPEGKNIELKGYAGKSARAEKISYLENYTLNLKNVITPYTLINWRASTISLNIEIIDDICSIDLPKLSFADQYKNIEDEIKVWERKYYTSTFTNPGPDANPDHKDGVLLPRWGSGAPHFPYEQPFFESGYQSMNKLRGCWASEFFKLLGKTPLSISISTLTKVEKDDQHKEYIKAWQLDLAQADVLNFSSVVPPYFESFLGGLNKTGNPVSINFLSAEFKGPVYRWDDYKAYHNAYKVYPHWRPGGHRWGWDSVVDRVNCMVNPPVIRDIQSPLLAHINHREFMAVDFMTPADSLSWGKVKYEFAVNELLGNLPYDSDQVGNVIASHGIIPASKPHKY